MAKKEKTESRMQYDRELRRIKNFIRKAEKRGYIFSESVKAEISKKLKRTTKLSVEKLKKLTPAELYKKSKFKTPQGKYIRGTEGVRMERSAAAKKSAVTRKEREKRLFELKVKENITPNAEIVKELNKTVLKPDETGKIPHMTSSELASYVRYFEEQKEFLESIDKPGDRKKAEKILKQGIKDAIESIGAHVAGRILEEIHPWGVIEEVTGQDIFDVISFDVESIQDEDRKTPEGRESEARKTTVGGYADEWIIDNFIQDVINTAHLSGNEDLANYFVRKVVDWIRKLSNEKGTVAVSDMIQKAGEKGIKFGVEDVYDENAFAASLGDFINFLGAPDDVRNASEEMAEFMEENQAWEGYDYD